MTNRRRTKQLEARRPDRSARSAPTIAVLGAVAVAAIVGVALYLNGAAVEEAADEAPDYVRTGEINSMDMPVIETPGGANGFVTAGGVEVSGAHWEMGTVPLLVAVRPSWVLTNTSSETITLGEPHPEVRAGCCPGPLVLGVTTLEPGASTTLTFELSMHPGMDGWHDIVVHVPVISVTGEQEVLQLDVTADFRGSFEG